MSQKEKNNGRAPSIFNVEHLRDGEDVPITHVPHPNRRAHIHLVPDLPEQTPPFGIIWMAKRIDRFIENYPAISLATVFGMGALAVGMTRFNNNLLDQSKKEIYNQTLSALAYTGPYHIPGHNQAHREVSVGSRADGFELSTLSGIADYVNHLNPNVDYSDAITFLEAENAKDQLAKGVPKREISPDMLSAVAGQGIGDHVLRLPKDWEGGRYVPPTKNPSRSK